MSPSFPGARRRRFGVLVATTALLATGATVGLAGQAYAATGGTGAPVPYVHVEAETSATNAGALGPDYTYNTVLGESSGRRAVTLDAAGEYVEFTVPSSANSIVTRISIPDTGTGSVYTAPLSLYIDGVRQADITTTNKYSHLYGGYQFSNSPQGNHHWFYDEYQRLTPQLNAGTKVRIQKDANSSAASYTVDFMEFEQVAPALTQPAGSVSVTSQGADPTGVQNSMNAFNAAIAAAGPGGTVWIPAGTFLVPGHLILNNVNIRGAGMWHSIVTGTGVGFYGRYANEGGSSNVNMSNFQIRGEVIERCDSCQVNGIGGAISNSNINNIWIEHTKVGMWMDGPFTGLTFDRMRVRDLTADGVNFHMGVTNSTVSNSQFRNAGDDGMAMWSEQQVNANNSFNHNTVEQTQWANGMAIYGGSGNSMTDNLVIDSGISQGGGMHVANRFASTPLAGTTSVLRNTIVRSGGLDPNWQFGVGSLWFDARDGAMTSNVVVDDLVIRNTPYEAIHFVSGGGISNVNISNVTIDGVGTFVIQSQVGGSNTFKNIQATRIGQAQAPVYNCAQMVLNDGGGNGPWWTAPRYSQCGMWPTPVIWPDSSGVTVAPSAVDFGAQSTNTTSSARSVTVTNNGSSAATIGAPSVTGDFAVSGNTCGSSLAAGASCSVSVTFTPTAGGNRSGSLTVAGSTVSLSGSGVAPGPILNTNPATLSYGSTVAGSSSAAQTVTVTNTGTTTATVSGVSVTGDYSQTNNCTTIAVNASCTVNVTFSPTVGGTRTGTLTIASNANNAPTTVSLSGSSVDSSTNIAVGKTATANSTTQSFVAANAVDGSTATYWEGSGAYPQWLQVDLASATNIGKVVVKLPPATAWATRTQTYAVQTSLDGTTWTTVSASAGRVFDPATGNTNTVTFAATNARYVRLSFTGNTGASGGQVAELEVYLSGGGGGGSATLGANPSSVSFASQALNTNSASQTVTVTNTGTASGTVSSVAVTGDYSQTNNCGVLAASASCTVNVTFRPTASGTRTGTLTVNSNATNPALTVALSGTGATSGSATLAASPTSLTFASQAVNTSSATQTVTISNTGTVSATVSGVATSGDYSQTNNCGTIAANGSCAVTVTFRPTASGTRTGTLTVSSNATNPSLTVALSGTGTTTTTSTNLSQGKATSESGHNQTYASGNSTDGNQATYWESVNNAFPQWLQVDLGSAQSTSKVILKVPAAWGTRTETLSVLCSNDGTTWTTLSASAGRVFNPSTANTVTITYAATTCRYVRLNITGNTGWPAGQISEFQVWNF
ncbi:MAG: coagulation factor 5/8 type domain protein [Frankiales bacterium]|nr:coagulation factor 5/8 type domain protein [Frankiales bacterium]